MTDFEVAISIILSAVSALFSIATFLVALFAFLGWQSYKDFKEKMDLKSKEVSKIKGDIENQLTQATSIIKDLTDKKTKGLKTKKQITDYQKKAEEIVKNLEEASQKANRISGLSSTGSYVGVAWPSVSSSVLGVGSTNPPGYVACSSCGYIYSKYNNMTSFAVGLVDSVKSYAIGNSKCPKCGHVN